MTTRPNAPRLLNRWLQAAGYPVVPASLADQRGVRSLRRWIGAPRGSVEELAAVLGCIDPEVTVGVTEERAGVWPVHTPPGMALLAAAPPRRHAVIRAKWRRSELLPAVGSLRRWCRDVARAWLSFEWDGFRLEHGFPGGLAVERDVAAEPASVSMHLDAPYARSAPCPALAVLAVQGSDLPREAGRLVVSDGRLERFLVNVEPFRPVWQVVGGRTQPGEGVWVAREVTDRAFVVVELGTAPVWSVSGRPAESHDLGSGVYRLRLPRAVQVGGQVTVRCRDQNTDAPLRFAPNPVVFQTAERLSRQTVSGGYHEFRSVPVATVAPPGTFRTLVAGSAGIHSVEQLRHVYPTPGDTPCAGVADVCRLLPHAFLGLEVGDVAVSVVLERSDGYRFRRAVNVVVRAPMGRGVRGDRFRTAVAVFLRERFAPAGQFLVSVEEVMS